MVVAARGLLGQCHRIWFLTRLPAQWQCTIRYTFVWVWHWSRKCSLCLLTSNFWVKPSLLIIFLSASSAKPKALPSRASLWATVVISVPPSYWGLFSQSAGAQILILVFSNYDFNVHQYYSQYYVCRPPSLQLVLDYEDTLNIKGTFFWRKIKTATEYVTFTLCLRIGKKPKDLKKGWHHLQMAPIINVSTSEIGMLVGKPFIDGRLGMQRSWMHKQRSLWARRWRDHGV